MASSNSIPTDVFHCALAKSLEARRSSGRLITLPSSDEQAKVADFGSNDVLSISSGILRQELLQELEQNPRFSVGSRGSRILDGTSDYLTALEHDIARFHGAQDALFFNSGYDANVAIYTTLPQPGDCIVYDELIHASAHDGFKHTRAQKLVSFKHNDSASLSQALETAAASVPGVRDGSSSIFIALESVYSMDGDICPIHDLMASAKESSSKANLVFVMDEAHSNGILGPDGAGLVCHYGLQSSFPIRLHTFGKGLGSTGAVVLCHPIVKSALVNYARNFIFTTAPTFMVLAAVRAGYKVVRSREGQHRRDRVQSLVRHFFQTFSDHPTWKVAVGRNRLRVVGMHGWRDRTLLTPIVPIVTGKGHCRVLAERLCSAGFLVHPVQHPIVPLEEERVRIVIHANNTEKEVYELIDAIMRWVTDTTIFRSRI